MKTSPPSLRAVTFGDQDLSRPRELRRDIIALAGPVLAEMALMTIAQIVDMAMVSRLGPVAIAAVNLSFQPINLATALFMGLGVGTTAVVARLCGEGNRTGAAEPARQSTVTALLIAIVLAVPAWIWAQGVVRIMGAEPDVVTSGAIYIRAMLPGLVFMVGRVVLTSALRGAGDTRTPLKIGFLVNVINIFGNWVLIFGNLGFPALGVLGAGLATSIARILATIVLILLVIRHDSALVIRLGRLFRLEGPILARVARISIPAAMERLAMSTAMVLYVRIVAGLGTIDYAAHAIAINAESISFMPAFAFAQAATTVVGQSLGARRPDLAERAGWECFRLGGTIGAIGTVVLFVFPYWLMRIYTTDPLLIAKGMLCLRIMALGQIPMAAAMVFSGALRGAGDTRPTLIITAIGTWATRLPLAVLFVGYFGLGLGGAWAAMAIDWLVRGSLNALLFHRGHWKLTRV